MTNKRLIGNVLIGFAVIWIVGIFIFSTASIFAVFVTTHSVWTALSWPSDHAIFETIFALPFLTGAIKF